MGKGERTRQFIIEKSAHLFNEKGYYQTSLSDIMNETGLKKGGIYRHFKDKNELMIESFYYAVKTVRDVYLEKTESASDELTLLQTFFEIFKNLAKDIPVTGGCPIFNASIEMDCRPDSELLPHAQKTMRNLIETISEIIESGIKNGRFHSNISAKEQAIFFISSLEGGLALSKLYQDSKYLTAVCENLEKYIQSFLK
ncbi:TetR/AcrR family transcriptional regulator [Ureibacillus sp. FSL K6-8385]|uniref:TetR/AcrR family transcriptional regulator n=1 Tax=Ureibacillus terrenus TaxID=118246 RepID=A0A540V4R0_9BACL|nr:TetR/AcrR family transcriptional regulator [Ureibacillus terrenus]MED3661569.1 TetR/AcrR family transcriptional regulator [Ureibacillus terrenus]MED3763881.1 TetR/AcrR family transcriptional regulator [Ureibacillus terrenus]TQE91747.1 TetR/AcrR family transcriptional regulator [Ureibacillus terrenus]